MPENALPPRPVHDRRRACRRNRLYYGGPFVRRPAAPDVSTTAAEGATTRRRYQQCYRRVRLSLDRHPASPYAVIFRAARTSLLHCPGRSVAVLITAATGESATSFSNARHAWAHTVDAAARAGDKHRRNWPSSSAICHWLITETGGVANA